MDTKSAYCRNARPGVWHVAVVWQTQAEAKAKPQDEAQAKQIKRMIYKAAAFLS